MEMGELIEFPLHRRFQNDPPPDSVLDVVAQTDECSEYIHVFVEVPGRCKCGENEWTEDHTLEPEGIGIHHVFDPPPAS
jgi:hypothetical protein